MRTARRLAGVGRPIKYERKYMSVREMQVRHLQHMLITVKLSDTSEHDSYANVTIGQPCQSENTTYTGDDPSGQQIVFRIARDNCHTPDLFCDPSAGICAKTSESGSSCNIDRQCETVCRKIIQCM